MNCNSKNIFKNNKKLPSDKQKIHSDCTVNYPYN